MVDKVKLEVELDKEIFEVGNCIKSIIKAYKTAVADGFTPATDIPAILLASIADLMKALDGVQNIGAEFKDSPVTASKSVIIPILEGVELLLQK
jgi:hypothetical protein